jgi:hypothetical protein
MPAINHGVFGGSAVKSAVSGARRIEALMSGASTGELNNFCLIAASDRLREVR